MAPKICFSYTRFSSKRQARGTSELRQKDIAAEVAKEKGWTLDTSLNIADLGVSAFKKDNLGSIRAILAGVKSGRIPKGAVMIIEAFDRLTRIDIHESLPLLTEILNSGLELYINRIGRHLTIETLKDAGQLTQALYELKGSYEYSAKLAERLGKAWKQKKTQAADGKMVTSRTPAWITIDKTMPKTIKAFGVDHTKAKIIKRIFKEYLQGKGPRLIALGLNADKIPNFDQTWAKGKGWSSTPIKRFLTSVSVIGNYQPNKYTGKSSRVPEGEPVEGYYPAIIDKALFYSVQERMREKRTTRGARRHLFNLFSGLIKCEHCGTRIVLKVGGVAKTGDKKPLVTLICAKAQRGMGCKYRSIKYYPLEKAFLTVIWLKLLLASYSQEMPDEELATLQGELQDIEAKSQRLEMQTENQGDLPIQVLNVFRQLNEKAAKLKEQIALLPVRSTSPIANWKQVPNDIPNRMLVQGMVTNIVENIILDPVGRKATIAIRGGSKSIKVSWPDDFTKGFILQGEHQDYLDDVLIWKSPRNVKIGSVTLSDSNKQPAGRVLTADEFAMEHMNKKRVKALR